MVRAIPLSSAILGALFATGMAGLVLIEQAASPGSSIFPMLFLVLFEWAAFGITGAVYLVLTELRPDTSQVRGAWSIVGAYVPLILLGAFSIGPNVLVSAVLLLVPTLILTLRNRLPIIRHLAILGIGTIANLVLLLAFIALARVVYGFSLFHFSRL